MVWQRKTVNKVNTIEERQNFQLYLTKQNKSARSNSFNCLNKRMVALFIVLWNAYFKQWYIFWFECIWLCLWANVQNHFNPHPALVMYFSTSNLDPNLSLSNLLLMGVLFNSLIFLWENVCFFQDCLMKRKLKRTAFILNTWNMKAWNVFYATFIQFNVSKHFLLVLIKSYWPQTFERFCFVMRHKITGVNNNIYIKKEIFIKKKVMYSLFQMINKFLLPH